MSNYSSIFILILHNFLIFYILFVKGWYSLKIGKAMASFMSVALLVGVVAGAPLTGEAKSKKKPNKGPVLVDRALIDTDRLTAALKSRGELDEDASPEEIEDALHAYITRGKTPFSETDGIDTSTDFGKEAYKGARTVRQDAIERMNAEENSRSKRSASTVDSFVDNAVVALIEFPDFKHNSIEDEGYYLWTKDFNQEHYEGMLFNKDGYTTPEGKEMISVTQFYNQQSAGSWSVDGVVTPWIMAEKDAAEYGKHDGAENDADPVSLVKETLEQVGKMIAGHEEEYDQRDPRDIDGDGNVMEPDGMLDNLIIVHAGVGEEAGGGALGDDAIWSHRSTLGEPIPIPGTTLKAYDYIIQPEDGAPGVFAHEYGHNLGLPDEYDSAYSGLGSPVENWSLMSGGSWNGTTPGTEPTGFSPWAKLYFHDTFGGGWPEPKEINSKSLRYGKEYKYDLDEAVSDSSKGKLIKINLPDRDFIPPTKPIGKLAYHSTKGNELDTRLISPEIDLTDAKKASLSFDSWREIEEDYDYLYVNVYEEDNDKAERVATYTGTTDGQWTSEEIDLSDYAGKKIKVEFEYKTDVGFAMNGAYLDNLVIKADDKVVLEDDVEGEPQFELDGFVVFDGKPVPTKNYYLIEWRSQNGVDQGLAHYRRSNSILSFDPGMLVWYYDGRWGDDNMTGLHPGEGFLGIVDSHQRAHYWDTGVIADTRYQLLDASFGKSKKSDIEVIYPERAMSYKGLLGIDTFADTKDYSGKKYPDGGKLLPVHGLSIKVKKEKEDGTGATIVITRDKVKK